MEAEELHLKVYADRSIMVRPDGTIELFSEGNPSAGAKARYRKITETLQNGFLDEQIVLCRDNPGSLEINKLTEEQEQWIDSIVDAMSGKIGRGLVGLTIMQLCIKAIEPEQSIRLHKGGDLGSDFSWKEGVSMRTLDNHYITPALRRFGLVSLNKDGFMMTRTLAENYPYSSVYKARIAGAREQWALVVEAIEAGTLAPKAALQHVIAQLINKAAEFQALSASVEKHLENLESKGKLKDKASVLSLIKQHIEASDYAARVMEVAMHSLAQAMQETHVLGSSVVKPMSQMRSANKKHGNIGDIELLEGPNIVESWDAKFGKSYLRDELEELDEKLASHTDVQVAGFVTSIPAERLDEIEKRRADIAATHGIELPILTLDQWVDAQFQRAINSGMTSEQELAERWIQAHVESLSQKRPEIAPIDEPCYQWLHSLKNILVAENTR